MALGMPLMGNHPKAYIFWKVTLQQAQNATT